MKKEMIKAIRMVKGYTTDLRVNISPACNKSALYDWIQDNAVGIFGKEEYATIPPIPSKEYDAYEKAIIAAVHAVITGRGD